MLAGRHCRMERLPITSCRKGWNNKLVPLSDLNVFSYLTNDVGRALFSHHVKIHLLLSISNRVSMHSLRVHDWVNFHTQLALYIIIWNLYLVLDPFLVFVYSFFSLVITGVCFSDLLSNLHPARNKWDRSYDGGSGLTIAPHSATDADACHKGHPLFCGRGPIIKKWMEEMVARELHCWKSEIGLHLSMNTYIIEDS